MDDLDHKKDLKTEKQQGPLAAVILKLSVVVILIFVVAYVIRTLKSKDENLKNTVNQLEEELSLGPRVRVFPVTKSSGVRIISLVGETRPYASVTLYAKLSGYLQEVFVDKGDQVKKDQVLAIIESLELDQEILGAKSDVENREAISKRLMSLSKRQMATRQEAEQAKADAQMARAKLRALLIQKSYATIRAPFDGVINFRYADPGALIQNAINSQASALPLLTVSRVEQLRINIYLDQRDANYIKVGTSVKVSLAERPEISFEAKVARTSGELDTKTRMLLAEIEMDNRNHDIVSGSFVLVSLKIQAPSLLEIPIEALVVQKDKTFAAVINSSGILSYREIKVKDNDGKKISLISGLSEGEYVAVNVGNSLIAGTRVQSILPPSPPSSKEQSGRVMASVPSGGPSPEKPVAKPLSNPLPPDVNKMGH